ncbi:hypothetical protein Sjap_003316 [Stephania japonica]|uniref:Uncharacterized protein n=1 Tax=Stephania japonica TaxID=461633 RepID=A0AAP0KNN9_9MAGN
MAETPDSGSDSTSLRVCEIGLEEQPINASEMSVSRRDEVSASSDSFVVDMGRFSDGLGHPEKEMMSPNSRITVKMPRSFSRKGSQISQGQVGVADSSSNGNKTAITSLGGGCNTENNKFTISPSIPSETKQFPTTEGVHVINIPGETKLKKSSSRQQRPWNARFISPRRVLFFFATISSMGTLLLLYFTLFMARAEMES